MTLETALEADRTRAGGTGYRYKKSDNTLDFYGESLDYIHFKFGDALKQYNFTDKFRKRYPGFCAAYELAWEGKHGVFSPRGVMDTLKLLHYIKEYEVPVRLYSNMVDLEFADVNAALEWYINEHAWSGGNLEDKLITYNKGK